MPFVIFATPFFSENAARFIDAIAGLPDVRLGVISQEPQEKLALPVRARLAAHWRIDDCLNAEQLVHAARMLSLQLGPIHRLFGAVEQMQVPLAEARQVLGVDGMGVVAARNFRDKARMKDMLRAAGVPSARHRLVAHAADAIAFAQIVGYPVVVKPLAGAGAQSTFRADGPEALHAALATAGRDASPEPAEGPILVEEFMQGDEGSCDTISIEGRAVWHSLTHYLPSPLEVMRNPWMQWCLLLPREIDEPQYDDVRRAAFRALEILGMDTGLSHLEWFRRPDGTVAVSEVAARPPGAQITTVISRAHDVDFLNLWARVMVFGQFESPARRYAAGAAYLRGQGQGLVRAVHGWDQVQRELGALITDARLPQTGQAPSSSYEGEGYVILRHEETDVVEKALHRLVSLVRVELG